MTVLKTASMVAFIGLFSTAFVAYFVWADRDTPLPNIAAAMKAGCEALMKKYGSLADHYPNVDLSKCDGLDAKLNGTVWTVGTVLPEGYSGGGVSVDLSKIDGRILYFSPRTG